MHFPTLHAFPPALESLQNPNGHAHLVHIITVIISLVRNFSRLVFSMVIIQQIIAEINTVLISVLSCPYITKGALIMFSYALILLII